MANRLKLDFSLQYSDERAQFLEQYLTGDVFSERPPTEEELETMGNYVLWGKDRKTGLNAKQAGLVPLASRSKDWDNDAKCESLDALMESPAFNEASLGTLDAPQIKTKREVFSREEALKKCPDFLKETFLTLFAAIDELDLKINYYEIQHGRRIKEPREELLRKFSDAQKAEFQECVTHWNQFMYLKQRHQLVEMRRQQYTLKDSYSTQLLPSIMPYINESTEPADFDAGIEVLPLGTFNKSYAANLVFKEWDKLNPNNYSDEALKVVSDFYWQKHNYQPTGQQLFIDFRNLEHVYQIFQAFYELDNTKGEDRIENHTVYLLKALEYYVKAADLNDIQRDILNMKLKKMKNTDIAITINKQYQKSYTPNYISTIFRQRIIPKINEAAEYHAKIISNLFFPEEFKTCTCCGRTLLKDAENFTRKTRSKDGYTTRCKKCEKIARNKEKNE